MWKPLYVREVYVLQSHVGVMWLKLLLPCTYVKDTNENAPIKTDLIFLLIQHSSKEDRKGNSWHLPSLFYFIVILFILFWHLPSHLFWNCKSYFTFLYDNSFFKNYTWLIIFLNFTFRRLLKVIQTIRMMWLGLIQVRIQLASHRGRNILW